MFSFLPKGDGVDLRRDGKFLLCVFDSNRMAWKGFFRLGDSIMSLDLLDAYLEDATRHVTINGMDVDLLGTTSFFYFTLNGLVFRFDAGFLSFFY